MLKPNVAIGVAAGVLVLLAVFITLVWFCKSKCRSFANKNSDTSSSDPSGPPGWNRECRSSSAPNHPLHGRQGARQFTMEELEQATKQFNESNLVGYGSFGPVYKGLLHDTIVAIKRRHGAPQEDFVAEVTYLSEIRHRNLVALLGYCQESGLQALVFEYIPNGSMCNHLYDTGLETSTKLEFKQRLSITLGAAKGLCHLHALNPPVVHKKFKMANVLVDENFTAKVADAGVSKLLEKIEEAGPSEMSHIFQDPEVEVSGAFTEMSDVYSFGVFILELITGQEASHIDALGSDESLMLWVTSQLRSNDFVDHRLMGSFTTDGMRNLIRLTLRCMSLQGNRRPKMEMVVTELERILEKEMALTTVMGEGTATFIKGSELFTSS